jgi:hypothetical protein
MRTQEDKQQEQTQKPSLEETYSGGGRPPKARKSPSFLSSAEGGARSIRFLDSIGKDRLVDEVKKENSRGQKWGERGAMLL